VDRAVRTERPSAAPSYPRDPCSIASTLSTRKTHLPALLCARRSLLLSSCTSGRPRPPSQARGGEDGRRTRRGGRGRVRGGVWGAGGRVWRVWRVASAMVRWTRRAGGQAARGSGCTRLGRFLRVWCVLADCYGSVSTPRGMTSVWVCVVTSDSVGILSYDFNRTDLTVHRHRLKPLKSSPRARI
jgi:hypothetical protein